MIDPTARLSVVQGISRSSIYYQPRPVSDADLKLMHRIDKLHMELPFAGSRMLQGLLIQEGSKVGRLHIATLMKLMGIEALYRRPNTSKSAPDTKSTHICSGSCPSRGPIRSGPWTSPISRWRVDLSTWQPCWTGSPGAFWHCGCRLRWTPIFP